jgi:hypothetical protein
MAPEPVYNPMKFLSAAEIITIAVLASFVTMKLLNVIYENVYEPAIESVIDTKETENYYVKIGRYYVQVDIIVKEFIKWIILILLLMLLYNIFLRTPVKDQ